MTSDFSPGDRVRYLNADLYPTLASTGTVDSVESNGMVNVDWDGEGVGAFPNDPIALELAD